MLNSTSSNWADFAYRTSRRRWTVFLSVFLVALTASLTYVYTSPAEYRAVSRIQITPARSVAEADELKQPRLQDQPESFLTEVQVLTSRPVLEAAIDRLKDQEGLPELGPDPVGAVRTMLRAEPVADTPVVLLSAVGPQQSFVWRLVNAVAEAYRDHMSESYKGHTSTTYAEVNEEVQNLSRQVDAKRKALNAFRDRYDIVSLERGENTVLADIQNVSRAYATSNEALAKAESHLQALMSGGADVISAKDDPTLAAIEQRASVLREQLTDLQRRFTPQYLELDADTKALEQRVSTLDQQLADKRMANHQAAIAAARQEVSANQATVARLGRDLDENRQEAQTFVGRLADLKVMQDDLDHLQGIQRAGVDRLAKLQASEGERAPRVELLELAAPSLKPWRPDYPVNALIALMGSFGLGLFAVWFSSYISGPSPVPAMMLPQPMMPQAMLLPSWASPSFGRFPSARAETDADLIRLPVREPSPRELDSTEVVDLLSHASEDVRLVAVALLSGLSAAEVASLRWDQIDFGSATIRVEGDAPRTLPLQEPLAVLLALWRQSTGEQTNTVLHDGRGGPATAEAVARLILSGAYDAGLDRPEQITPAALRHTYLLHLLRRGIRAADLGRIAGHIPHDDFVGYMRIAPSRPRLPLEQVDRIHPALRQMSYPGSA